MDTKIKYYLTLLVFTVLSIPIFAQRDVNTPRTYYEYNRDWTLGIHGGFSWQQSDVNDRFGGGIGLDLGHRFYGQPGSFWALDWRGRLTYSNSFGQGRALNNDTTALNNLLIEANGQEVNTYDQPFFDNYRTDMVDANLEVVLTANRLRERTGIILQGFGGLGFNFYNSKVDQLNGLGETYDYSTVNLNQSNRQIRRDIGDIRNEFFRGGNYESGEGTKLTFMPSWGLGIGYQVRPWFSFGYEHRFAYPFTDELDSKAENNVGLDWINDKHHLSALYARFHFGAEGDCLPPTIKVTSPTANPLSTQAPSINVLAEIENISNRREITVTVNGLPNYSFDYNTSNDRFTLPVLLDQGENVIRIVADNSCDEDIAVIRVIYNPNVVAGTPPSVVFTRPSTNNFTTSDATFAINAEIQRVKSKTDVEVSVNGMSTRNFNYNSRSGSVSLNVNLIEGNNTVVIKGTNRFGEDSKTTNIIYNKPVVTTPAPRVRITRPSVDPFRTADTRQQITATLDHVVSKNDVTFRVNGVDRNFSYNSANGRLTATVDLAEGSNSIVVEGYNIQGKDSDETTIIVQRTVVDPIAPPIVTVTAPSANPHTVTKSSETIRATIKNVSSKNDVTFTVNGRRVNNFTFNSGTNQFRATINLEEGSNAFNIKAVNRGGQDEDAGAIIYNKMTPVIRPPVVDITQPRSNPHSVTSSQQVIKATIRHATRNQIQFTVNGSRINNFSFNDATDSFSATISVIEGSNAIVIKAVNNAGSDVDDATIIYKKPVTVQPPTVNIIKPTNNDISYTSTAPVEATITNVTNKSQITFTVNGKVLNNFTFNANTNTFAGTASNLTNGTVNKIKIVATNSAGIDQDEVNLIVRVPNTPPVVTIQRPNTNPATVTTSSTVIQAKVDYATKSQIKVLLNGSEVNFSFNSSSKVVRANVNLRTGNNSFTVRAQNNDGTDQDGGVIIYRKPVTVPAPRITVTKPTQNPFTTTSNRTVITAKITNIASKSGIKFIYNGSETNSYSFNPGTGAFSYNAPLKEGSNRFTINAQNAGGNDSYKGEIIYKKQPTVYPPQVVISTPQNGKVFTTSRVAIKASIKNVKERSGVTLSINGDEVNNFNFNGNTSALLASYNLKPGVNTIVIEGRNSAGNDKETVKVTYRDPASAQKPVIQITSPTKSPFTTATNKVGVSGKILYIGGKSDASVRINGSTYNNWTFDQISKEFLIDYTAWRVGTNNVVIKATNAAGSTTKTQVIIYRKVSAPVVTFTAPIRNGGSLSMNSTKASIKATVTNSDKKGVIFTHNGKRMPYTLSGSNFSANLTLLQGANTIKIVAKNDGGQDTETITLNYTKPVLKPTVRFTKPGGSITVRSNKYSIRAVAKNINAKKDITVVLNDQNISSYSFNANSGTIAANLTLKEGNNTVRIAVRNSAGADVKTVTIRYQKPSAETPSRNNGGGSSFGSRGIDLSPSKPKTSTRKPSTSKPRTSTSKPKPSMSKPKPQVSKPRTSTRKPSTSKPSTSKPKSTSKKPAVKKPATKKPSESNSTKKDEGRGGRN